MNPMFYGALSIVVMSSCNRNNTLPSVDDPSLVLKNNTVENYVIATSMTSNERSEALLSLRGDLSELETDAKLGVYDSKYGLSAQMAATVIRSNPNKLVNWNAYIYSDAVQQDVSVIDISLDQIHGAVSADYNDVNSKESGWYIDGKNYAQLVFGSDYVGGQASGKTWTINNEGFHAFRMALRCSLLIQME